MIETLVDIEQVVNELEEPQSIHNSVINKIISGEVKQFDQKYQNFRKNIVETFVPNESELSA